MSFIPWAPLVNWLPRPRGGFPYVDDPATDPHFGKRDKDAPKAEMLLDFYPNAHVHVAVGAGLRFGVLERATWRRNEPAEFSDEATSQFKSAVHDYRNAHPHEAP